MPRMVPDDEAYETVDAAKEKDNQITLIYYSAQLFLRKRLNQVHEDVYGSKSTLFTKIPCAH